jgi:hypothetical protein
MNSFVALLLFGTPTAPSPSVRDLIAEATPGIILRVNGYVEGIAATRTTDIPAFLFV